jgi:hypothetical protein
MDARNKHEKQAIHRCIEKLRDGLLAPWNVAEEMQTVYGIESPDNLRAAALCRRAFIEDRTGSKFQHIFVPEKPYKERFLCKKDNIVWELDARDEVRICSLCDTCLKPLHTYAPLVANYIGGHEDYYSYGGQIKVKGDINKQFMNLLVYGTGLGPMGVSRGSFLINKSGGAEVNVEATAHAVRCLGLVFSQEESRNKAIRTMEAILPEIREEMLTQMAEFKGRLNTVEFAQAETRNGFFLYVDFMADFTHFRGHGDISRAVGFVKKKITAKLQQQGIAYELAVIAQGYDGDLKPSSRNKRGRYAAAQVRVPFSEFEGFLKVNPDKFLSFVEVDRVGAHKLGCAFYSGMGGEIIPAVYKATKVNPRSTLVTSFQNIHAGKDKGDVVYGVELPNVEAGVVSSREGLIPPVGREAMRLMGIRTAREFAASVVAQVLAGEFNLALEISREKLYC